tara:strand:- start:145 stop:738 length:594 start_codon:yes stop_codon:yes gene_type:complete
MIISIDGNIGSGKSTILYDIKKNLNKTDYSFIFENLEVYNTWIKLYYQNMNKYALGFQMEVLLSHLLNKKKMNLSSYNFIERSPVSCISIFGQYLLDNNILSKDEQNICIKYNKEYGWIPDYIIYIQTDPINCFDRINKRNRNGESMISIEYLQNINALYNNLYCYDKKNIYIINGNDNYNEVYKNVFSTIQMILNY